MNFFQRPTRKDREHLILHHTADIYLDAILDNLNICVSYFLESGISPRLPKRSLRSGKRTCSQWICKSLPQTTTGSEDKLGFPADLVPDVELVFLRYRKRRKCRGVLRCLQSSLDRYAIAILATWIAYQKPYSSPLIYGESRVRRESTTSLQSEDNLRGLVKPFWTRNFVIFRGITNSTF